MMSPVISLVTGRPVDPVTLPAFADFRAQQRATLAAEQAGALLVVADDLLRIKSLLAIADPVTSAQVDALLSHAGGVIIAELRAAAAVQAGRVRP
ncbi:hypothetical protein [Methylobacterium nodulans]|uniref:Uncharacterized protein n=1 Tax=Methylobacterium nodulans (strain LMG 21967 / CNCM I-2342 / ORS 2060) TaxID=460265 RepID=B8ICR2_METNO|nr:hypothetical protein [Methylobacterium nodulans]ACL57473.1 hypothetical protein Mnod_2503 [Methylobacterium nodulans ORS 2060]